MRTDQLGRWLAVLSAALILALGGVLLAIDGPTFTMSSDRDDSAPFELPAGTDEDSDEGADEGADEGPDDEDEDSDEPCTGSLFSVQDTDDAQSAILRLDLIPEPSLQTLSTCGICDIEAFSLNQDTGKLYGVAGGASTEAFPAPGDFFEIDRETGALTPIGNTGATGSNEIVSASWRSSDGSTWAFQEGIGLVVIDEATGNVVDSVPLAGALDTAGNPVPLNWEGLAWSLDGSLLYGADANRLYRWDPATNDIDLICENLTPPGGMIEALEFDLEGPLVGSPHETPTPGLVSISWDEVFGPDACTVELIDIEADAELSDLEAVAFGACEDVVLPGSCDDGKPKALVFEYTGGSCLDTTNYQEGSFSCRGPLMGGTAAPVEIVVEGDDAVATPGMGIPIGGLVTVEATGDRLKSNTALDIKQGRNVLQSLNIHTSCSKDLEVGDVFGGLILREFIPED